MDDKRTLSHLISICCKKAIQPPSAGFPLRFAFAFLVLTTRTKDINMGAGLQVNSIINDNNNNNNDDNNKETTLIFTYGTLKHGFSNHALLQEMIASGDAAYLGICRTAHKLPLVCGPYRVPFLLNFQGFGEQVWGELYSVSARALARMDELEGISRGHYQRLPITLLVQQQQQLPNDDADVHRLVQAQAYYAHPSYADALWKRNGEIGYTCYSHKEAKGYISRKDRPQHLSFLDQIHIFLSTQD